MDPNSLIIKDIDTIRSLSRNAKKEGLKVSLVPTMGALHDGHLRLIKKASEVSDYVIVSIFVNPTQFAPHEDFDSYPRDLEKDLDLSLEAGASVIFNPNVKMIYPIGYSTFVNVPKLAEKFEGEFRPQFFTGVATICTQLFIMTEPDITVFGQKDYQQSLIIRRMVQDLKLPIEVLVEPTIRESNGLAMSSRNQYLSEELKEKSSILFSSLQEARQAIENGERNRKIINAIMHKNLRTVPEIKLDYASSALAESLETPEEFLKGDEIVLLIAVHLGKTRLIDNTLVKIP